MAQLQDFRVRKGIYVGENATVTGNTLISQRLSVTNATSLSNTLSCTGAATFNNTVGVTGATTLSSSLSVSGVATFGSSNATFDSSVLTVDATNNRVGVNTALGQTVAFVVNGDANVVGTFTATNISTTANITSTSITVGTGNSSFDGSTLFIDAVNNRVGINNNTPDASMTITGTANVSGSMRVGGLFTGVLASTFSNTVSITGDTSVGGTISVTKAATFANTIAATGAISSGGNVTAGGSMSANGISSNGNITITNGSFVGTLNGQSNTCARSVSAGSYLTGGGALTADVSLAVNASTANDGNKIVARDASGNFSAGVVTANLIGTSTNSNYLLYNSGYRSATADNVANSIMARDGNGDTWARYFRGTATSAQYADLAEIYSTDDVYPVGTVIAIGGSSEATAANTNNGYAVIGVVSENPAYLMNYTASGQPIALKGRVYTRVVGAVNKGDRLIASEQTGCAQTYNGEPELRIFGISLETNVDIKEKMVEAIIL